jgi:hypothetical protein
MFESYKDQQRAESELLKPGWQQQGPKNSCKPGTFERRFQECKKIQGKAKLETAEPIWKFKDKIYGSSL